MDSVIRKTKVAFMPIKRLIASLCLLTISSTSHAAVPSTTFDLKKALTYAVQNSPKMEILRREVTIKQMDKRSARFALYPQVDAETSVATGTGGSFESQRVSNRVGVAVSQNIYDNGKSLQQLAVSSVDLEMAELALLAEREHLALAILESFYDLSLQLVLQSMNRKNLASLQKQFESIERSYKQGLRQQNDFLRIKVDVQSAQLRINSTDGQIKMIKIKLANLIGNSSLHDATFKPIVLRPGDLRFVDKAPQSDFDGNFEKRSLDLQTRMQVESLKLDKRSLYPEITLSAFAGFSNDLAGSSFFHDRENDFHSEIRLSLNYPIWDWGTSRRTRSKAFEREAIAKESLRQGRNQIDADIANLQINLKLIHDNYELNKKIDANSQKSFDVIQNNYKRGKTSYLDLASAFRERLATQENLIRSEFDLALNLNKHLSMQGKLYETLAH